MRKEEDQEKPGDVRREFILKFRNDAIPKNKERKRILV